MVRRPENGSVVRRWLYQHILSGRIPGYYFPGVWTEGKEFKVIFARDGYHFVYQQATDALPLQRIGYISMLDNKGSVT